MLFIGPEAERRFGHRHFMTMTAVFTGAPEFTVLVGREELGRVDPALLTEEVQDDRRLLLNGRSWRVTYIDWRRRRCFCRTRRRRRQGPLDNRRLVGSRLRVEPCHA